jgi:hypothetical protein
MTNTPLPLPSEGGSYTRDDKGRLVPTQPEPKPETAIRKPDVKEG